MPGINFQPAMTMRTDNWGLRLGTELNPQRRRRAMCNYSHSRPDSGSRTRSLMTASFIRKQYSHALEECGCIRPNYARCR